MSSVPFFLCPDCGSDIFLVTPERGPRGDWFIICKTCVSCYELWPNGWIRLARAGIQASGNAQPSRPAVGSFVATET